MSREHYVRMQQDAIGYAIAAHERGDRREFRDAVQTVVRAGHALGIGLRTDRPGDYMAKRPKPKPKKKIRPQY